MPDTSTIRLDEFWIEQCYRIWEMRDFEGLPPLPQQITHYPEGFIDTLHAWHRGIKYYQDTGKRESGAWL